MGSPLFVILEINGEFWFGPDWGQYVSFYELIFAPGPTWMNAIPEFIWPENCGTMEGLRFLSCLTDPGISTIISNLDVWSFSFCE